MTNKNPKIELSSRIWHALFSQNKISKTGVIVEVAPGHEPKIANALAILGFRGTIFLIEPDPKITALLQKTYEESLPKSSIKMIVKSLQNVRVGIDIPANIDALVASHPFDDMVISSIVDSRTLFSHERADGINLSGSMKKLYDSIADKDYAHGIAVTINTWRDFIERLKPKYFIASQYPSYTLRKKGLFKRQNSGFAVLNHLKSFYKNSLKKQSHHKSFGFKSDSKWWIVAKNPCPDLNYDLKRMPLAMLRLGKSTFVPQQARQLDPKEYDIIYTDKKYFGKSTTLKQPRKFALVLDLSNESQAPLSKTITAYADKQKDKTDMGLSGNHGSGRAVYYGDRFNILGVGKTTLCKSTVPSHSTGNLELIGAMRRLVLSEWINHFAPRAPIHPLLLALKTTANRKWGKNPIPLSLLVRIDDGSLDRPSHVEQSPDISIDFEKILTEYARIDAEYFAYRFMLGAWSTSNYSLSGHIIDLESASFVKYRGPYYTSSHKYPHTLFGYEGFGFIEILKQLANVKNIKTIRIEKRFFDERRQHLGRCFLSLFGVDDGPASTFLPKHQNQVLRLSDQFEKLAKKISTFQANLNLYSPIPEDQDPSLLDMSLLFRNLSRLYKSANTEQKAFKLLVRQPAVSQITTQQISIPANQAEIFLQDNAVVTQDQLSDFLKEVRSFIRMVFQLLTQLDSEKCLSKKSLWHSHLQTINQNLPNTHELNHQLSSLAESYRLGKISPKTLGAKIEKLCELPRSVRAPA